MVGPNYKEPKKPAAKQWIQHSPAVKVAPIQTLNWWSAFRDPTLTALIQQGYQNNLSLQIAGVRVLQARATLAQSVGNLYPQKQALTGDYSYIRTGGGQFQGLLPTNFETATLGPSASWELDFWGKYRRAIRSNDAAFLASLAAYDNALVILTAEIAEAYVNIRTLQAQIKVTKTNINVQSNSLKIANSHYHNGQTSLLDVQQAQASLAETQSTLPTLRSDLQRQKDKLALLLGTIPGNVDALLINHNKIPKPPPSVAIGIPKEALAKRPDIYQARMEAIAQLEAIGAIKANLYPALSLSGTFVFSANNIGSSSISDIFNWSNRAVLAGPSFNWPILNYGQITNSVRQQDAVYQQAILKFLNLVLQAQQEVQDNITRYIESKKSQALLVKANIAALQSTKLALVRYREGESDYTTVLDAQRQQLRIETSLTTATGDISKALIALYRSLGGGWQLRGCNDIVSNQIKAEMGARTNWGNLLEQKNHQYPLSKAQQTKERYIPNW